MVNDKLSISLGELCITPRFYLIVRTQKTVEMKPGGEQFPLRLAPTSELPFTWMRFAERKAQRSRCSYRDG
jgi:hypothetical protein